MSCPRCKFIQGCPHIQWKGKSREVVRNYITKLNFDLRVGRCGMFKDSGEKWLVEVFA